MFSSEAAQIMKYNLFLSISDQLANTVQQDMCLSYYGVICPKSLFDTIEKTKPNGRSYLIICTGTLPMKEENFV